jgi:hypothetical protein
MTEHCSISVDLVDKKLVCSTELNLAGDKEHSYDFSSGAHVRLRAHSKQTTMLFDLGTVSALRQLHNEELSEFLKAYAQSIKFDIFVTNKEKNSQLEGLAEGVAPSIGDDLIIADEEERKGILPLESKPMQDRVWRINFDEPLPILEINDKLGLPSAVFKSPEFMGYALPAIFSEIVSWEMKEEVEDDEERPWRQYLEEILNLDLEDELLDEDDTENFEEWIEKAKDAFETRWNLVNTLLSRKETGSDD